MNLQLLWVPLAAYPCGKNWKAARYSYWGKRRGVTLNVHIQPSTVAGNRSRKTHRPQGLRESQCWTSGLKIWSCHLLQRPAAVAAGNSSNAMSFYTGRWHHLIDVEHGSDKSALAKSLTTVFLGVCRALSGKGRNGRHEQKLFWRSGWVYSKEKEDWGQGPPLCLFIHPSSTSLWEALGSYMPGRKKPLLETVDVSDQGGHLPCWLVLSAFSQSCNCFSVSA